MAATSSSSAKAARPSDSDDGGGMLTVVSAVILVGTEILGVAIAAGWAIAGLFELGQAVGYVLMGGFSLIALWILWAFWKRARAVELGRSL